MRYNFFTLIFIGVFQFSLLEGGILTQLNSNNDHGVWTDQRIHFEVIKDLTLRYRSEQRLGANFKKYWFYDYEGVFQYHILSFLPEWFCRFKSLTFGPGFNWTKQFSKNTLSVYEWVWIHRPVLEAKVLFDLFGWAVEQRIRGEYYNYTKKHNKDYGLYRHRVGVNAPWKLTFLHLNPFMNNEWFFRNKTYSSSHTTGLVGPYYENRFRVGFDITFSDNLSSTLDWQWRATKQKPGTHPGWFNQYHYCVDINLQF